MKTLKKLTAGFFLLIGIAIMILGTVDLASPNKTQDDKDGALAAMVIFGVPAIVFGGWLFRGLRQENQQKLKQLSQHKEQVLLQLLEQENKPITVTSFALAAKISIAESQQYLDEQALKLNADFDTTEEGGIIYKFPK
jgi:hypothetical protein